MTESPDAVPTAPASNVDPVDASTTPENEAPAQPEVTAEPAAEEAPAPAASDTASSDAAASDPAPKPRRAPKPGSFKAPSPAAVAKQATHPVVAVPVASDVPEERVAEALAHGTVENGAAFVIVGDVHHEVGPAADAEALRPYALAYFELEASVERLHARVAAAEIAPKDIDETLASLEASLATPAVVGDLAALATRLGEVREEAVATRERIVKEREEARKVALAAREEIVATAEAIAAKPEAQVHWKNDTATLRGLLDQWKEAQRTGARIPKDVERELWKRFTHARSGFEKARKHHFAELDRSNSDVASSKERLVERAEELATTTDWDRGARGFRDLMNEWRSAGRGRRSVDDALWKRFQAAQDSFFESRRSAASAEDEALSGNVEAKEAAVVEAEALLPIKDLQATKRALRPIQDRFEAAGRVPRADVQRLQKRMGAVEKAVRDAEDAEWNRRNPELEARATGMAGQLQQLITQLEDEIAEAKAAKKDTKKLEEALAARKAWLAQVEQAR